MNSRRSVTGRAAQRFRERPVADLSRRSFGRVLVPALGVSLRGGYEFMTTTTLVILGVIVLAVILIAVMVVSRAGRMRRPALKPLVPESRDRYASQWDRIESRFVDAPEDAVKEADALILALLGEREHPLRGEKLPAD